MTTQLLIGNKNTSSWSLRAWLLLKHFDIPFEEVRFRLDHVERGLKRLRAWGAAGLLEELPRQPATEAFRSHRPGFAMFVDQDVG